MQLLIYGSRDFALTAADLARDCGHEPVGCVDDFHEDVGILGTLHDVSRSHPPSRFGVVLAIGYNNLPGRWQAWQRLRALGYRAPALVHPRAYVAPSTTLGEGCMVMAGALLDQRVQAGEVAVFWPGACISHDSRIGANTFVSPNATVCGFAHVGAHVFVGAASAIVDHGDVPDGSFLPLQSRYTRRREQGAAAAPSLPPLPQR